MQAEAGDHCDEKFEATGKEGAVTPTFELGLDFCTMHLPSKFHHPMFTRSEVIVLTNKHTNKQTPLKTFNALRHATTLGKYPKTLTFKKLHYTTLTFPFHKFAQNSEVPNIHIHP